MSTFWHEAMARHDRDGNHKAAQFARTMIEAEQSRSAQLAAVNTYLNDTPEHAGMFIPFKADAAFHPSTYAGNYEIVKGTTYAVRRYHHAEAVEGKALMQTSSFLLDGRGDVALFETQKDAEMAVHRHKLHTENVVGGIYLEQRIDGLAGWLVIQERHWSLGHDRVPWSEAEQDFYRDADKPRPQPDSPSWP